MTEPEQDDLVGYGFSRIEAPTVKREIPVLSPTTGKAAGFIGRIQNRKSNPSVYTALRTGYHFYYEGGGYAISDTILDYIERRGIARIIVHEGTSADDDVYEFKARQYYDNATAIPAADLEDEEDPQSYVDVDSHLYLWEGHAADLFMQDFQRACDRIARMRGWPESPP